MDYLGRDSAPLGGALWTQLDAAVISAAKTVLTGRRFLPLFGPMGVAYSVTGQTPA